MLWGCCIETEPLYQTPLLRVFNDPSRVRACECWKADPNAHYDLLRILFLYVRCIITNLTRRSYPTNLFYLQGAHMNMIISLYKLYVCRGRGGFLCLTNTKTHQNRCKACLPLSPSLLWVRRLNCRWSVVKRTQVWRFGYVDPISKPEFILHGYTLLMSTSYRLTLKLAEWSCFASSLLQSVEATASRNAPYSLRSIVFDFFFAWLTPH